jgi:hypothetical protein
LLGLLVTPTPGGGPCAKHHLARNALYRESESRAVETPELGGEYLGGECAFGGEGVNLSVASAGEEELERAGELLLPDGEGDSSRKADIDIGDMTRAPECLCPFFAGVCSFDLSFSKSELNEGGLDLESAVGCHPQDQCGVILWRRPEFKRTSSSSWTTGPSYPYPGPIIAGCPPIRCVWIFAKPFASGAVSFESFDESGAFTTSGFCCC